MVVLSICSYYYEKDSRKSNIQVEHQPPKALTAVKQNQRCNTKNKTSLSCLFLFCFSLRFEELVNGCRTSSLYRRHTALPRHPHIRGLRFSKMSWICQSSYPTQKPTSAHQQQLVVIINLRPVATHLLQVKKERGQVGAVTDDF